MIPTSFQVVNRRWVVKKLSKELAEDLGRHGDMTKDEGLIRVCVDEGNEEFCEHSYFHELTHALLEASTKPKLSKDEEFVDNFAAILHQYLQTKKGKLI